MPDDSSSLVAMTERLDAGLPPGDTPMSLVPVRALNKRSPTLMDAAVGRRAVILRPVCFPCIQERGGFFEAKPAAESEHECLADIAPVEIVTGQQVWQD